MPWWFLGVIANLCQPSVIAQNYDSSDSCIFSLNQRLHQSFLDYKTLSLSLTTSSTCEQCTSIQFNALKCIATSLWFPIPVCYHFDENLPILVSNKLSMFPFSIEFLLFSLLESTLVPANKRLRSENNLYWIRYLPLMKNQISVSPNWPQDGE